MKKIIRFFFALAAMMISGSAFAQISHGGSPLFNHAMDKAVTTRIDLDEINNDLLLREDESRTKGSGPMRVGVMQDVAIDVVADGKVVKDAQGTHFLLSVNSPGASFVSLHFSDFQLSEGSTVFFYDQTGDVVLGSFLPEDVMDDGTFYTQSIPGSTIYIEYFVPAGQEPGRLVVDQLCHGYRDIFGYVSNMYDAEVEAMKGQLGYAEGDCHINVVCSDGDDWRSQIRSVVALEIRSNVGSFMCSGAVINNTRQDRTPYVLSAYHCQDPDEIGTLRQIVTYFLYESRYCESNAGGSISKSITGATIKSKLSYQSGSDFLLLQLNSNIPDSYTPYYAGWDRTAGGGTSAGACIHHPGGDYKKISFPLRVTNGTGYYSKFLIVNWYTGNQNRGVTEQGSSGSPLFNAQKRIVGQLFAGTSSCDSTGGIDLYGRFYSSWTGNNTNTGRLSAWLDPDGTNVSSLDGLDYQDVAIDNVDLAKPQLLKVFPNPSKGMVYFDVDALGDANYKVFDLNGRCVAEGRTVLTATSQAVNLGSLPEGSYVMHLYTSSRSYSATVVIAR